MELAGGKGHLFLFLRGEVAVSCRCTSERCIRPCTKVPNAQCVFSFMYIQDVSNALKLVYERCGDEFAAHLLGAAGPAAGLPPALSQQLAAHVRESGVQELREFLRGLLTQAAAAAGVGR